MLGSLRPGMLLLADRGFYGVDLWCMGTATGADLLWRVRKDLVLPVVSNCRTAPASPRFSIGATSTALVVGCGCAVEYTIAGHEGPYRLLTTILDPSLAPAAELAALYAQ
ncbi:MULTISPECIES: hypothetical protein [unclassified Streptomyces]|uniref:hypothetical protein n=1 Tax=unclassified Streptomyces TaxID=2593676 RepID=UPI000964C8D8|nr:hypothetical protein [Streptomyces sp. TSRI0281]OKI41273.1 hypothetical protein A6A29_38055 [Streptomyces sp. TSRI0281]